MTRPITISFVAGATGTWRIESIQPVVGEGLPRADFLSVQQGPSPKPGTSTWALRGVTSNSRYATRAELDAMGQEQEGLGRDEATCAVLIPIRKSEAWWALAQDQRREIIEERSAHFTIGLSYLPAISRRLHHSRELDEPFDFLTWFEFAPEHTEAFNEMLRKLRVTEEWRYVERETDVRLIRV